MKNLDLITPFSSKKTVWHLTSRNVVHFHVSVEFYYDNFLGQLGKNDTFGHCEWGLISASN